VARSSPASKPVSKLQQSNPREFQLGQVLRRFSPTRIDTQHGTILSFTMAPSDPDFPFELEGGLRCDLTIPESYPENGKPALRVTNSEMPRGFQINVEKGFGSLVVASAQKTLLALLNDLDRNLERFLTTDKAQTIKIIANAPKVPRPSETILVQPRTSQPQVAPMVPSVPSWTSKQRSNALAKRQADVRQLEARMGRVSGFTKTSDGTSFIIPVQIAKPSRLPVSLQPLKDITLLVPKLYNLEPCTVLLNGVYGAEVEHVQLAFEKHVRENNEMSLMAHVNYLTQNIYVMATEAMGVAASSSSSTQLKEEPGEKPQVPTQSAAASETQTDVVDKDRPHLHFVHRPPEWDSHDTDGSSSYESTDLSDTDDERGTEDDAEEGGASLPAVGPLASTEKGVHLDLPGLELYNIELLTIDSLSLSVKCLRCKSVMDVPKIKATNHPDGSTPSSIRTEMCIKCTTPFTFTFATNPLHANSNRAGTIEATGCTVSDMLPSVFQPTCSSCSTTFAVPPGMISVRGDTPIQVCRACHAKMTFTIHDVKFLRVSHASTTLPLRRPKKENLGISAGTPLPNNGTCPHYRHSYRWFRFSCCSRVYACDRCHDAAEEHVNERAERMVCGWCSREQRFRSEDCGVCGRSVMRRRKVGGFWEGGQGTRDRTLMSRKEGRKYKRPSGKEAASMQGKKH
jgi:uncharacterized CHY-type Zn-finger protein